MATVKVRRFRGLALLIPILVLGCTEPALAIGPAQLGPAGGCGAPAGSAINQYCEAFPTATGGKQPRVGTPSVANNLPPRVVHELAQGTPAQQRLLTLPAARHHKQHRTVSTAGLNGPETSVWSLSLLMIVILALLALGLGGAAFERRRRRRAAQGPPAS